MTEASMEREKGSDENAGTTTCPTCGAELELKAQPDGSVAAETCQHCYGGDGDGDVNSGFGTGNAAETPVEAPPNPDEQPAPGTAGDPAGSTAPVTDQSAGGATPNGDAQ